jgi:transcriptional regulator with XRE-family HTH domain
MIDEKRLYEALGSRLKRLREAHVNGPRGRLTQGALAELVGLERTSITNIENGNQKVPLHVLYRICEQLNAAVPEVLPPFNDVRKSAPNEQTITFGATTHTATPLVAQALVGLFSDSYRHES